MSNLTEQTDSGRSYDPERWDPKTKPSACLSCGTELRGSGDGSTVGEHCPNCKVSVWIA